MNDPWWAVPAATLAGVVITVAATATLEHFRAKRERDVRLFDARQKAYTKIASLVRRGMTLLKEGREAFQRQDLPDVVPKEVRDAHRRAAVLASLIGSAELVEAIDLHYQTNLEAWLAIRRAAAAVKASASPDDKLVKDRIDATEREALVVINVLRKDTGVPGKLRHQWF